MKSSEREQSAKKRAVCDLSEVILLAYAEIMVH